MIWNLPFELTYRTMTPTGWPQLVLYCTSKDAYGEDNGFLKVSFRERSLSIKAHSYLIGAIAFHPTLPILATYNGVDKEVKIWYIPSELSSNPVLISILKVPASIVFSIVFHPKLPIVFIGKQNGDIEVWRAN